VQRRIQEITPNPHNEKLFPEALSEESIAALAADIAKHGLRQPIRITKVGAVIIEGERRWRACKLLGWTHIEAIVEDCHRKQIFEHVVEAASLQRQMTLVEQARVYKAYYLYLTRAQEKGTMGRTEAKHIALRKAQLPFRSITLADRLVYLVENGDTDDIHERVLRGDTSIQGAYERLWRRFGKPEEPLPHPEPSPHKAARERARQEERRAREEELAFTQEYIDAHQEELASAEAQRRLLQLFEPEPPPAAQKFRENEATQAITEAFEALAVKEPPEQLAGRLTAFVESIIASVSQVDEQRARDIIRAAVKPMVLRLAYQFPRREFDVPVEE
jgi:ParB-like chromosome segregation protein Spo0J